MWNKLHDIPDDALEEFMKEEIASFAQVIEGVTGEDVADFKVDVMFYKEDGIWATRCHLGYLETLLSALMSASGIIDGNLWVGTSAVQLSVEAVERKLRCN